MGLFAKHCAMLEASMITWRELLSVKTWERCVWESNRKEKPSVQELIAVYNLKSYACEDARPLFR